MDSWQKYENSRKEVKSNNFSTNTFFMKNSLFVKKKAFPILTMDISSIEIREKIISPAGRKISITLNSLVASMPTSPKYSDFIED